MGKKAKNPRKNKIVEDVYISDIAEIKEELTPDNGEQEKILTADKKKGTEAVSNKADTVTEEKESTFAVTSGEIPEKVAKEPSIEEKYAILNDKHLRLLAEYDNYRKRKEREFSEFINSANAKLITELLPLLDNLDRATGHRNKKTTLEKYVKGVALIEDQLRAVLSNVGLEPIDVVGKQFNPTIHDARGHVETDQFEPGIVIAEEEKGYLLSGKVIRYPKVIVSK